MPRDSTSPRSRPTRVRGGALLCVALLACSPGPDGDPAEPWLAPARAGEQAFRAQRYQQAEAHYSEALGLAEAADSESGRLVVLDGLAASHAVRGDLAAGDSLYTELLRLQQRRFDADSLSGMVLVRTLGSLGEINLNRGRPERAHGFFSQILELDAAGDIDLRPEEAALAYTIHGLGQVLRAQGQTVEADSLAGRAMGLKLYAQGFTAYVGEDIEGAGESYRRALAHQERVLGSAHPDVARTAHALGRLYEFQGNRAEAVRHYRRAVHVYHTAAADPLDHAQALEDLAGLSTDAPATADSLEQRAAELRGH